VKSFIENITLISEGFSIFPFALLTALPDDHVLQSDLSQMINYLFDWSVANLKYLSLL